MAVDGQLSLKDRVTAKLNRILKKMNRTVDVNTKLQRDLRVTSADFSGVGTRGWFGFSRVKRSIDETTASAERLGGKLSGLGGIVSGVVAAFSVAALKNKIDDFIGLFNKQHEVEMQLAVVLKNQSADKDSFNMLREEASRLQGMTTFGDEALLAGAAELGTYLSEPEALKSMMSTLTNYAAGMGGINVDPRQMVEYATGLGKALDGHFEGLNKKGFILSDAQKEIIRNGTEMERVAVINDVIAQSWDGLAESFASTPEGKIIQINNKFGDIGETIGGILIPSVVKAKNAVAAFIDKFIKNGGVKGLTTVVNFMISALIMGLNILGAGFEFVGNNWSWIEPILIGALSIFGMWKAATIAQTIAQLALNVVTGSFPLFFILAAVGLIIMAISRWVKSVGGIEVAWLIFTRNLLAGWDVIKYGVQAGVNHSINFLEWLLLKSHEIGAGIANGISGISTGIIQIIADTINVAVDLINGFIKALNWIPGVNIGLIEHVSFGATARASFEAGKQARADEIEKHKDAYENAKLKRDEGLAAMAEKSNRLYVERTAAINDAAARNQNRAEEYAPGDPWGTAKGGNIKEIEEVGEVGKIGSDVSIADEDIKLLKEYGTMKYVQNFITYTPTVAMHDTVINEKVDVKEVISEMDAMFAEEADAFAEEVHL